LLAFCNDYGDIKNDYNNGMKNDYNGMKNENYHHITKNDHTGIIFTEKK
jgi:hypothetical protein